MTNDDGVVCSLYSYEDDELLVSFMFYVEDNFYFFETLQDEMPLGTDVTNTLINLEESDSVVKYIEL